MQIIPLLARRRQSLNWDYAAWKKCMTWCNTEAQTVPNTDTLIPAAPPSADQRQHICRVMLCHLPITDHLLLWWERPVFLCCSDSRCLSPSLSFSMAHFISLSCRKHLSPTELPSSHSIDHFSTRNNAIQHVCCLLLWCQNFTYTLTMALAAANNTVPHELKANGWQRTRYHGYALILHVQSASSADAAQNIKINVI